eukprot:scaffold10419_cov38-Phaeocystis_antarctica.AAC.1
MAVGRVNAAPIARPLCRSSVDTTPRARGPRQVVAAGVYRLAHLSGPEGQDRHLKDHNLTTLAAALRGPGLIR